MENRERIPSIDGFRAIAILLVVYWHLQFSTTGTFPNVAFDWGTLGVYVFFVISGFLITTLLQREREQTQSISLKNFYTRRFFRIFPPLICFLVAVEVFKKLGLSHASGGALLFSLTFLRNYYPGSYRILHHLWSLSVEEQFYLVWPFLFTYLSKRNANRLLTAIVIAVPIIRLAALHWGVEGVWHTERVADGLAWGCLLAINQKALRTTRLYHWFSKAYGSLLLLCVVVAAAYTSPPVVYAGIGQTAIFVSVALLMDIMILRFDSSSGRILNSAPLVWIGGISYSLYLWQQLFLLVRREDQPYAWFPMNLALSLLCAVTSFYLIERPAIRFGRKIIARRARPPVLKAVPEVSEAEV